MTFKAKKYNSNRGNAPVRKFYDPYEEEGRFLKKIRKEVILPGVTPYEEYRLGKIHNYIKEKTGEESTVPQHMINDIYSMYVNKDIQKKKKTKYNAIKRKVIDKTYNSLTKMVANDSVLFSQIVAKELALYLQKVQNMIEEETKDDQGNKSGIPGFDEEGDDEGEGEDGDGQSNNDGSGQNKPGSGKGSSKKSMEQKVDDILNKTQKDLDNAMKNAEKEIKEIEDLLGKDASKELSDASPTFMDDFNKLKELLKRVSFNKDSIKTVLMKILNKSQNYFSKNSILVEESLFDADELEDLFGLEHLHPIFRNTGILEVGNEGRLYTGKIDLYLDCSGSMSSSETFDGKSISMKDLVKGIAIILYRMNMIDKLYFFDDKIYEIKNINEFTILSFEKSGGTNFNNVVNQVNGNKRNSVVITDGDDSCAVYSKNVFWIGIGGTRFQRNDEFNTYRALRQCVTYNRNSTNFDYCK